MLLQLIAHGIVPSRKLGLEGLIALPELPFLASMPPSPLPAVAKRLRLSSEGKESLSMDVFTGRAVPRPEWAVGSVNLHAGLAVAALLELLVEMHNFLSAHPSREHGKRVQVRALGHRVQAPQSLYLAVAAGLLHEPDGAPRQDLIQAFDHFDR